jgi:thioredoxin-like negative regulator of GroEL
VRGFPTLVAVAAGRHIDYRGPRDEDSLARVADRIAAAPITPLPAEAALDECVPQDNSAAHGQYRIASHRIALPWQGCDDVCGVRARGGHQRGV